VILIALAQSYQTLALEQFIQPARHRAASAFQSVTSI